jgi:fatty-acyl-CoA synthase
MSADVTRPDASEAVAPRPVSASKTWLRAMETAARLTADPAMTFAVLLDDLGTRFGAAPALLSDAEQLSFEALAARSRQYTRWALDLGLGPGDGVGLLAPNSPDYFACWVGVSRTGCVVSLLNTNLRGVALGHCLDVAGPAHIIVDGSLIEALDSAGGQMAARPRVWRLGEALDPAAFDRGAFEPGAFAGAVQADTALHIFTSGTTGLPKAARISHGRILSWSGWFCGLLGAGPQDRLYDCLPMYHSIGGVTAIGAALAGGASVVIREKFSASAFWSDIVRWDCTLFQYIGELCRYLLAAPEGADERRHRLRLICGNGLREEVWTAFQARFAIPAVLEFYAATEGSFSLYNVEGRPGAIGRTPPYLAHRFPAALIRFDSETEAPARGPDGLCVACGPDEVGEAVGRVSRAAKTGAAAFEGYTDAAASDQKLLRDVFEPGDLWFRTGDLMRKDPAGYFYFVDRIGDSFRWKGENVAGQEVADMLARCPGVREAVVYGVAVPGADGRAGMAAIVVGPGFDLERLAAHVTQQLPAYARPLFLRVMDSLPATETFKPKRQALAREGYDPAQIGDRLYLFDLGQAAYRPLDAALHEQVKLGLLRL